MGLIRKSLMIGTAGLVRGSSKKQRVAKAQLKELKQQTKLMAEQAREEQQDREAAFVAQRAAAPAGSHEQRKAELDRIRAAATVASGGQVAPLQATPAQVTLPPEGWYPHPDREDLLRWWDGLDWTDRTAPRITP